LWNGQSFTRPAVPQSVQAAPSLDKRILQALIEKGVITEADIENLGG
jgi:2-oxoglutarate dehydrogenase complex dehydrogenase (E1) component-like enzyme